MKQMLMRLRIEFNMVERLNIPKRSVDEYSEVANVKAVGRIRKKA